MPKLYCARYDDPAIRGQESERPWALSDILNAEIRYGDRVLDVGSGTGKKTLGLAQLAGHFTAMDPSGPMRQAVLAASRARSLSNVTVIGGVASEIPLDDATVDVLVCILAPWDASEFCRVLDRDGTVILEVDSELDKRDFKCLFGEDENGPRGQFLGYPPGGVRAKVQERFSGRFEIATLQEGAWESSLTPVGLVRLLSETNLVRDFCPDKDADVLRRAFELFSDDGRIRLSNHRLLMTARKCA